MSDEKIKAGDKVRSVMTWTTYSVERGDEFVVEDVRRVPGQGALLINGEWIPEGYFERIYPEPWTEPEKVTKVVLERRQKGSEGPWFNTRGGFVNPEEALMWLDRITRSPQIKGLPQEYRVVEIEITERTRVLGAGATPDRE